jgi:CheY-like chemotaxis protein
MTSSSLPNKGVMNAVREGEKAKVGRRVLVVDDNLDHVRSLTLLLGTTGHHVDYAINATVAVDLARRQQPDIVFLDLLLPDGHGADVCRELRRCPELSKTRIIGVTASSRMLDHQLALDAGCDDVLRKPVAPGIYERLIAGGMCRRKLREFVSPMYFVGSDATEARSIPRPLRVLVVDDEPDTVLSLTTLLRGEGYAAKGAYDGTQALTDMEVFDPDVMIVDIAMPQISGWDVAREVRTAGRRGRPMLIAISGTYISRPDENIARAAGFSYFLTKPCDPSFLFNILAAMTSK